MLQDLLSSRLPTRSLLVTASYKISSRHGFLQHLLSSRLPTTRSLLVATSYNTQQDLLSSRLSTRFLIIKASYMISSHHNFLQRDLFSSRLRTRSLLVTVSYNKISSRHGFPQHPTKSLLVKHVQNHVLKHWS